MAENAISQLNTLTQSHRAQPPVYTERPGGSAAGQQFAFGVSVCVGKARLTGTGYGSTKRDAKLAAAENVLSKYRTMAHDGRIHTHPWSPPSPSQHSEPHSSPDYTPASPIPAHVYAPASPEFSPSYCPTSPPYAPVPVPTDFQFQAIHSALESLNQRVSALEHELANVRLQLLAASSTPAPPAPKQQRQEMTLDSGSWRTSRLIPTAMQPKLHQGSQKIGRLSTRSYIMICRARVSLCMTGQRRRSGDSRELGDCLDVSPFSGVFSVYFALRANTIDYSFFFEIVFFILLTTGRGEGGRGKMFTQRARSCTNRSGTSRRETRLLARGSGRSPSASTSGSSSANQARGTSRPQRTR